MAKKMPGSDGICPRCFEDKPRGSCGKGIAQSRRGKVAICAACGTSEGLLDAGLMRPGPFELIMERDMEKLLGKAYRRPRWLPEGQGLEKV